MAFLELFSRIPITEIPNEFRIDQIERQRLLSLSFYNKSNFPNLLKKLEAVANGKVIEGREDLTPLEGDIHWPLYEESVVMSFFWGREDAERREYTDSALGVETMPDGTIYIHGGGMFIDERFPFGSSVLLLSEWKEDKDLQLKVLQKAFLSPKVLQQGEYMPSAHEQGFVI